MSHCVYGKYGQQCYSRHQLITDVIDYNVVFLVGGVSSRLHCSLRSKVPWKIWSGSCKLKLVYKVRVVLLSGKMYTQVPQKWLDRDNNDMFTLQTFLRFMGTCI